MTPEKAAEARDECTAELDYLYDKLDRLQKRKAKIMKKLDDEISRCQQDIYSMIETRKAIEDAHFATEDFRDIQDLTFDDVT